MYIIFRRITLMWWRCRVHSMWTAFCKRSTYLNWIISLSNFSWVWNFMCPHLTSPQINICVCECLCVYDCKKHEESSLVTYTFFLTCLYQLFCCCSLSFFFFTLSLFRLTLFLHSFVVILLISIDQINAHSIWCVLWPLLWN